MSLTPAQRNAIWTYLGYEAEPSTDYGLVAGVLAQLAKIDADPVLQTPIDTILTQLAAVDAAIVAAGQSVSTAGPLKKVDEIEFYQLTTGGASMFGNVVDATHVGRMLVRRLAQRLVSSGANYLQLIVADYFDLRDRGASAPRVSTKCSRGW